jgi:alpha-L-fucosidase
MGNGQLDPEAVRIYRAMGEWLKVNGESIYATRRNPLSGSSEWGDCSVSKDGKALYVHVLEWPESGTITVKGVLAQATAASYLANGQVADFIQQGDELTIKLPSKQLDEYDTVVKVIFADSVGE